MTDKQSRKLECAQARVRYQAEQLEAAIRNLRAVERDVQKWEEEHETVHGAASKPE